MPSLGARPLAAELTEECTQVEMLARLGRRFSAPPSRFEAVAQSLAAGEDPRDACAVLGRRLAADGTSLDEAMDGLRTVWQHARGCDPDYEPMSALLTAWNDATLAFVHQLSCADPVTGLSTVLHVRSRLSELYLQSHDAHLRWALLVCELPAAPVPDGSDRDATDGNHRFVHSMRLAKAGEAMRTVFVRGETVGRLGHRRVVALVERDDRLGTRVRLVRGLLERTSTSGTLPRVWIEGLPDSDLMAAHVLDELAR